jgi:hypothetical protein
MTQGTRRRPARPAVVTSGVATVCLSLILAFPATVPAETPLTSSGEMTCERAALGDCDFVDPATGLVFRWPSDWPVRRLKIVTESGPRANARQRGATRWIALQYMPDDPTQPEVALFSLAVLERDDWIVQSARTRVATSVEVATGVECVAVVSLPGGHPYAPETRDADIFEALLPTVEQVSRTVEFPTLPRATETAAAATQAHRSSIAR